MARAAAGRWDIFVPYTGPHALAVAICAMLTAAPALPGIAANAEDAKIPDAVHRCALHRIRETSNAWSRRCDRRNQGGEGELRR